jgi:hypothetical protein
MYHILLSLKKDKKVRFLVIAIAIILCFAIIYWLMGNTNNFHTNTDTELTFLDALYFAMGTHTTIGYGDITAKSQLMRGIASMQIALLIIQIAFANL